jgi:hypothetical protein
MKAPVGWFARLSAVLLLLGSIAVIPAVASSVPITNPNFDTVANCAGVSSSNTLSQGEDDFISVDSLGSGCVDSDPFNGTWTASGDVGVWNPGTAGGYYPSGTPGGNNIAFANNGSISQVLSTDAAVGTYTLTVEIGGRCNNAPINNYGVELVAGSSNVLVSDSDNSSILNGTSGDNCGKFLTDTLTVTLTSGSTGLGEPLEVVLSATGSGDTTQTAFAETALDFESPSTTPEPSSLTLFGSGLLAMAYLLRRKRVAQS